mgnify:CR=1 FL=1
MAKKSFVDWLYTTAPGRMTLKVLLYTGALKLGEMVARSQLSKPFISRYIKNNNIDMSDFKGQKYTAFRTFSPESVMILRWTGRLSILSVRVTAT